MDTLVGCRIAVFAFATRCSVPETISSMSSSRPAGYYYCRKKTRTIIKNRFRFPTPRHCTGSIHERALLVACCASSSPFRYPPPRLLGNANTAPRAPPQTTGCEPRDTGRERHECSDKTKRRHRHQQQQAPTGSREAERRPQRRLLVRRNPAATAIDDVAPKRPRGIINQGSTRGSSLLEETAEAVGGFCRFHIRDGSGGQSRSEARIRGGGGGGGERGRGSGCGRAGRRGGSGGGGGGGGGRSGDGGGGAVRQVRFVVVDGYARDVDCAGNNFDRRGYRLMVGGVVVPHRLALSPVRAPW